MLNKQRYWSGNKIDQLEPNQVFVFGSNPEGRHGLGAAKTALRWGAKYGKGRGLAGRTYALVTKNLKAGYREVASGITYSKAGATSVSLQQIRENIRELYVVAQANPQRDFLVCYQNSSKNLNGYTPQDMLGCFMSLPMPSNVLLHDSFKAPEFKLAIVGGRDFMDYGFLLVKLDGMLVNKAKTHKIVIVCGLAQGADKLGEKYAKERGYEVEYHPAKWDDITVKGAVVKSNSRGQYNAVAGHMRNEDMAKSCDAAIAFWDGKSRGTMNMIGLVEKHGKRIVVVDY